jgi:hypothetical protein
LFWRAFLCPTLFTELNPLNTLVPAGTASICLMYNNLGHIQVPRNPAEVLFLQYEQVIAVSFCCTISVVVH